MSFKCNFISFSNAFPKCFCVLRGGEAAPVRAERKGLRQKAWPRFREGLQRDGALLKRPRSAKHEKFKRNSIEIA